MNNESRRVLGIDHGINHTGWAIVCTEGNRLKMEACGSIETDSKQPFFKRLQKIYQELTEIIQRYAPQEMAVEEAIYAQNIKTALMMGHARGTVLLAGANAGLKIYEYAPKKIKSALVGNGSASKEQVQFMVKRLLNVGENNLASLGIKSFSLDISDALAVAICHLNQTQTREL